MAGFSNFRGGEALNENDLAVERYKKGELSLGDLARELGISLSETIDLLVKLGVRAPIDYDDYLEGYKALEGR